MAGLEQFIGPNAGYALELFERYRRDPASVDPASRRILEAWDDRLAVETPPAARIPPEESVAGPAGAAALAQAIRYFGHLGAQLDPLGSPPPGDPQLDPAAHDVTAEGLARLPASAVGGPVATRARTAGEAIDLLRRIYCATSGYELAHVQAPEERAWLIEAIETERFRPPSDPIDERRLLDRLTEVSAFERFLQRAYPGQTRFSIEGLGMMVPMLDELVARAAAAGTRTILLGMAHRGRLNVLAHVLGKPYAEILAEFEGRERARRPSPAEGASGGWAGDVTYHAGGRQEYGAQGAGGTVTVLLAPNPSHLEFVNPVVEGMARAANEDRAGAGRPRFDEISALPVLIHGDAAFMGQGVVAETLNLSRLAGYRAGGTIHLIANNQLGFTTRPDEGRSTLYASDLAKGFEIPVVHVNADDPTACLAAVRLAVAYRRRFRKDFLIDLIGYRRWGHNEGDEPSFTQPRRYAIIAKHPTVRELFAADLARRGVVAPDEPAALLQAGLDEFQQIRERVLAQGLGDGAVPSSGEAAPPPPTSVSPLPLPSLDELREVNEALTRVPEGFALNPKLRRPLERRRAAFEHPDAPIDWGHAETLAFATILRAGIPVRLTGQDTVRGTFSQRHLTFEDVTTAEHYTPLESVPGMRATFDARNSPLSEAATLGFEYGYSVQAPDVLVIWEAQYGDFINVAQVIVDEFVVSGQAKWGLRSGLVLLLPHGWEGQGPDHSSGRLERFLQLAAEDNLRVANPTTAAQYFHLLRRQAASLRASPRPLVVMTPKSLLRHPLAAARAGDLVEGRFQPVLDDPLAAGHPDRVRRVLLCSGKVWVDVASDPRRAAALDLALVRVEELYPFPEREIRAVLERYARAEAVAWLQEEPRNMGAWTFMEPRLRSLVGLGRAVDYIGRRESASPAEGWADAHAAAQQRIVEEAISGQPSATSAGAERAGG